MVEFLLFRKGKLLNYALSFIGSFFLVTTGWGQTETAPLTNPYAYSQAGLTSPSVTSDKDDYAPGETAIITGTGWTLDSTVDIHLEEEPAHDHHHGYHGTVVDANGNWRIEYPIEDRHLGVKFTVVVDGVQSKYQGMAYFTDGKISFYTQGLPANTAVNVTYSYDGQGNNDGSGSISIIAPGPTTYTVNNANFSYSFPNTVLGSDGSQYTLVSSPTGSIKETGSGNHEYSITGNYVLACTAPSSLSYSTNSASYCTGTPITANSPTSSGGAVTSYSISSTLPAGLSFNTTSGIISGTPTATSAATNYTITANNACGSTTATINITVGSAPSSLSYSTPVEYCVGTPISANSPTVTGSVTTYTVSPALPAGLNFNSTTGVIIGTPTTASAASNYTVTATNSCGSTTAIVNIGVDSAPAFTACPTDITANTAAGTCNAIVTYTSTASTNATSISYTFSGATLGEGNGNGSGSTFNKGTTTVTVTATNDCGSTSCSFDVIVNDNEAPVAPTLATVSGECSATVTIPTTTDNCTGTITGTTTDPLTYTEQGTHTVTFLFDDGNGNQSTTTQTVVIDDVTAPVAPVLATVTGECTASVTLPTAEDNCSGTITATTDDPLTYTEQGTHTVTFLFDDGNGNQSTTTQTVVIDDVTAPVAPTLATVTGECSASVTLPTAEDNCSGTITATTDDPLTYTEQGTHTVTFLFDDGNGNQVTTTQTVVIDDVTAPVAPVLATVTGECSASVTLPTAEDNCSGTITGTTTDPLTYTEQGTHTVTFLFDDGNGNQSTTTQTVVIDDVTAPVVPVLATVSGECSASVTLPTAEDNCSGTITGTTTDPLTYTEQGTHTVTFLFDDGNGNQSTTTQTVVIDDVTAPVAPVLATVTGECTASVTLPTAEDNCSGTITGTTTDPLTYTEQGTHTVTFLFDDGNGNQSTTTQTVVIDDVTAPVAPVLATVTGECTASVTLPTAEDNCSGTITATTDDPLTYTEQGTHTVTFLFDDGNGNQSTTTQTVVIDDVTAPVAPVLATVTGECTASVTLPTTTDNCSGTITATTDDPLTYTEEGTHTVTFLFDDGNGNQSTATQTVIVDDVTPAAIACVGNQTRSNDSGTCSYTVQEEEFDLVRAEDNCEIVSITNNINNKESLEGEVLSGTTNITWSVIDAGGNVSTCSFTVTVTNEAPVINSITGPIDPVQVNTGGVKLTASYNDNNVVSANWSLITNDGVVTEYTCADCIGEGTIEGNFSPQPGVYTVELEVTDACGETATLRYEYVVIFDPTGGFVTGGGWIESPVGAMLGDKYGVTGRANFGFNAKYKTGRTNLTEVDGHTNFQFKAGDLHFSSFEHEDMSLVIAGKKATYTGYGTVNGSGVHRFRVIAIDGQANGGTGPDQFRIKIYGNGSNSDTDVLYDNHRGIAESSDLATTLEGGSIVIHKPKSSGTKMAETTEKLGTQTVDQQSATLDILGNLAVAPNPVRTEAAVRFSVIEDANITLRIFDFNGREVNRLFQGAVGANEVKEVTFHRNNLMSGIYIVKLTTDRGHSYDKQIIVE